MRPCRKCIPSVTLDRLHCLIQSKHKHLTLLLNFWTCFRLPQKVMLFNPKLPYIGSSPTLTRSQYFTPKFQGPSIGKKRASPRSELDGSYGDNRIEEIGFNNEDKPALAFSDFRNNWSNNEGNEGCSNCVLKEIGDG